MRAKGFDTSRHNHPNDRPIDFQAAYDADYRFWTGRLTVGDYYIDPWIVRDYEAASLTPIRKLIYHVPRAGYLPISQVNWMRDALQILPSPDAIVLDVETDKELGKAVVTGCLREHVRLIRLWWTGKIILYTNLDYLCNYITDTCGLDLWIAWPASDKGYNPVDHPPVDNWRIYQRSWAHAIPGNPDLTVDLDEFNGTDDELYNWLGVASEPPEGEDMTALDDLKAVRDRMIVMDDDLQGMLVSMTNAITQLEQEPGPEPEPPPTPTLKTFYVFDDKAVGHFSVRNNEKGKMIMSIPPDPKHVWRKVQKAGPYEHGPTVQVYPTNYNSESDGTFDWWKVYGYTDPLTGKVLYVCGKDGHI
jgi:GH25 family lysozyme M1 (1,4-beta-N-acetylmuramidase)